VLQTSSHWRQRLLIQRRFTCVLTLCCFLFGSWKKLIDDSQQSAPFSIFLLNICYANKDRYPSMLYVRTSTFRQNRVKVCASINFSFPVSIY
jgi:hypothetical protein